MLKTKTFLNWESQAWNKIDERIINSNGALAQGKIVIGEKNIFYSSVLQETLYLNWLLQYFLVGYDETVTAGRFCKCQRYHYK